MSGIAAAISAALSICSANLAIFLQKLYIFAVYAYAARQGGDRQGRNASGAVVWQITAAVTEICGLAEFN